MLHVHSAVILESFTDQDGSSDLTVELNKDDADALVTYLKLCTTSESKPIPVVDVSTRQTKVRWRLHNVVLDNAVISNAGYYVTFNLHCDVMYVPLKNLPKNMWAAT